MHASTKTYLDLAEQDDGIHAAATAALRSAVTAVSEVAKQGSAKGEIFFAVQIDETDAGVRGLLYEGQDKQKAVQRLTAEWQERTIALIRVLSEIEDFDARFAAAADPIPLPGAPAPADQK